MVFEVRFSSMPAATAELDYIIMRSVKNPLWGTYASRWAKPQRSLFFGHLQVALTIALNG